MHWRKRISMRLPVVAALLGLGLAGPVAAQETGRITGRIVNANTNRPLAGVQVFVPPTGIGNLTDQDGRYLLQNVPAGTVTLTAQLVGFRQGEMAVTVTGGQTTTANLQLAGNGDRAGGDRRHGRGRGDPAQEAGQHDCLDRCREGVETAAVTDVSQLLAAREPGVSVLPSGGYTGQGARIRIRGSSSLSQLNEPIIYIDGIRMDGSATSFNTQGNASQAGRHSARVDRADRDPEGRGRGDAVRHGSVERRDPDLHEEGPCGRAALHVAGRPDGDQMPLNRIEPLADFARTQADIDRIRERWGRNVAAVRAVQRGSAPDVLQHGLPPCVLAVGLGRRRPHHLLRDRPLPGRERAERLRQPVRGPAGLKKSDDKVKRAQMSANVVVTPIDKVRIGLNTMYSELKADSPENGNNIYGVWPNLTQAHLRLACSEVGPNCPKRNLYGTGAFITANEAIYSVNEVESKHFAGSTNLNYAPIDPLRLDGTFGVDFINESSTWFRPFGWNVDELLDGHGRGHTRIGEVRTRVVTADLKASWEGTCRCRLHEHACWRARRASCRSARRAAVRARASRVPASRSRAPVPTSRSARSWNRNTQVGGYLHNQIGFRDWAFATVGGRWDANSAFGEAFNTAFYPKARRISIMPTQASAGTKRPSRRSASARDRQVGPAAERVRQVHDVLAAAVLRGPGRPAVEPRQRRAQAGGRRPRRRSAPSSVCSTTARASTSRTGPRRSRTRSWRASSR
jgi:TonB-dependent starch-binding outer membrane protein SusC